MDSAVLRIVDANLNRAREALRVIEDYARFALDDTDAASAAKRDRHRLREIVDAFGHDELLAARDIIRDVGRDTKTADELNRDTAESVVRAAFVRASEAVRTIGEYAKLASAEAAATAESLRYHVYELEQCVLLRGVVRERFRRVRLYVLITEALCRRDWFRTAEAALRGGAGCLQLREKNLLDNEWLARAQRLRQLTRDHNALFIINDRPDLARLCGADGVHLGQDDLSVAQARSIAGGRMLIGKSIHTLDQVRAGVEEAPDAIAVGPMFPSSTKPQAHTAGPETLRQAAGLTDLPLIAIGGITAENAGAIRAAGASCICVCSAVISDDDPEAAARRLLTVMETH